MTWDTSLVKNRPGWLQRLFNAFQPASVPVTAYPEYGFYLIHWHGPKALLLVEWPSISIWHLPHRPPSISNNQHPLMSTRASASKGHQDAQQLCIGQFAYKFWVVLFLRSLSFFITCLPCHSPTHGRAVKHGLGTWTTIENLYLL